MVQQHILKEVIGDKTYWRSASAVPMKRPSPVAHLLPSFDEYLVSYKDRTAAFEGNTSKQLSQGNNIIGPVIVIGGRVVGSWKRSLEGKTVRIALNYFRQVSKAEKRLVADAADRYGGFLGMRVVLA